MFSAATIHRIKGFAHHFIVSRLIFALVLAVPATAGAAELRMFHHHDAAVVNAGNVSRSVAAVDTNYLHDTTSTQTPASDTPVVFSHTMPLRIEIRTPRRERIEDRRTERRAIRQLRRNPELDLHHPHDDVQTGGNGGNR